MKKQGRGAARSNRGANAVEYMVLMGGVALTALFAQQAFGGKVGEKAKALGGAVTTLGNSPLGLAPLPKGGAALQAGTTKGDKLDYYDVTGALAVGQVPNPLPGAAGNVAGNIVRKAGGSQESQDIADLAAAGGVGAAVLPFAPPVGAAIGVTGRAGAKLAGATWDVAVAYRKSGQLERAERAQNIARDFNAIQGRDLNTRPLSPTSLARYERISVEPGGRDRIRQELSNTAPAIEAIQRAYVNQTGQNPSGDQLRAAQADLARGGHIKALEESLRPKK